MSNCVYYLPRKNSNNPSYVSWGETRAAAAKMENTWLEKEIAELEEQIERRKEKLVRP